MNSTPDWTASPHICHRPADHCIEVDFQCVHDAKQGVIESQPLEQIVQLETEGFPQVGQPSDVHGFRNVVDGPHLYGLRLFTAFFL